MTNNDLIFDLGFHNGDDTDFYLKKGFKVIAVEADPALVKAGNKRFRDAIDTGDLIILNKAVSATEGTVSFYVNPHKSDWSSCDKRLAEIDGSKAKEVKVKSVSFSDLVREFGVPRYAKVDIEGQDTGVASELHLLKKKPEFISFETSKQTYMGLFSALYMAGYQRFQLVNQLKNPERARPEQKKTEGTSIDYRFSAYSSGYFGEDLPAGKWLTFDEALSRYMKYKELKTIDNQELALGWLDLHARLT